MSINLKGCFSQQLNALLAYLSSMYCFRVGKFSTVGAQGITDGTGGGKSRRGQAHEALLVGTPELEHLVGLMSHSIALSVSSCDPTWGKFGLIRPRSVHAWNDRYGAEM